MSSLNIFELYDTSNYKSEKFRDITEFKKHFNEKSNESFIFLNSLGKEYNEDTINQINLEENSQKIKYLIYYYNNNTNYSFEEKTANDLIYNQIKIDEILSEYLNSKRTYLINSKKVSDEILERAEAFKEDKENINDFLDKYENIFEKDKECNKYIKMIKSSPKEIDSLLPKFKEIMESEINEMYNEVMNKVENIMKIELKGYPDINKKNYEEKKYIFGEFHSIIKEKLKKIINNQELIYSMQKKLNEILIYGEKINFILNLTEIPNIYNEINKDNLKAEYKRRNKFNYLYEKLMHFIESDLICKEFEYRKDFIKKNFKFSNKLKIEKNTLNILNKLIDFEAQQFFITETELYKSNYELIDDLTKSIDDLTEYLNNISEELFSKKKKKININDKNNTDIQLNKLDNDKKNIYEKYPEELGEIKQILRSSTLPDLKQNKIISFIENIILNKNNENIKSLKSLNNDLNLSNNDSFSYEELQNKNNANINKIIQTFSDTYGKFLWFYEKVFNYLSIYNSQVDKKNIILNKNDPFSINSYLINILNENKKFKETIKQIRKEANN